MINLESKDPGEIERSSYPAGYKLAGREAGKDELKVFINENVLNDIDKYLESNTGIELGGVLLGNAFKDENDELFIIIDAHIKAEHSTSSLSRLTFTHQTWDYINKILEEKFPSKKILGWYHSHPGHTVFLSSHDIFIQENFFNLPFMTAYVYDPSIKERGFFYWKGREIERSSGFYITDGTTGHDPYFSASADLQPPVSQAAYKEETGKERDANLKDNLKFNILLAFLLLNLLLSIILVYNLATMSDKYVAKDTYETEMNGLRNENQALIERIDKIITDAETGYREEEENLFLYTVTEGDDLKKIAREFYGNEERTDIILKENNLADESDIKPGQVLKLPKLTE